jgi:hypothetical protein
VNTKVKLYSGLPSKHEALSLKPNTTKQTKQQKQKQKHLQKPSREEKNSSGMLRWASGGAQASVFKKLPGDSEVSWIWKVPWDLTVML